MHCGNIGNNTLFDHGGIMKKEEGTTKHDRVLEIFNRLLSGEVLNKQMLADEFHVDQKSIQRDIAVIREFCSNRTVKGCESTDVVYDTEKKGYKYISSKNITLTNAEMYAVSKILFDSKALSRTDLSAIIEKITEACVPPSDRKKLKALTANEMEHYRGAPHGKELVSILWDLADAIVRNRIIHLEYMNGEQQISIELVKPVGLICSGDRFYLMAYSGDGEKRNPGRPAAYMVDTIINFIVTKESFYIPYRYRFEEGAFRNRPYMDLEKGA